MVAGIRRALCYTPLLVVLPILNSCIYSLDPACLMWRSHGLPRMNMGIGWFPRGFL